MLYIGVDIGGMSVKAGLVDEKGNILFKDTAVTRAAAPAEEIVADIAALVRSAAERGRAAPPGPGGGGGGGARSAGLWISAMARSGSAGAWSSAKILPRFTGSGGRVRMFRPNSPMGASRAAMVLTLA